MPTVMLAVAVYLFAANLATFAAFGLDKRRAEQGGWRIPEARLLKLAALGGAAGAAAAQQVFRHKTRKEPFASRLRLIFAVQAIILALVLWLAR